MDKQLADRRRALDSVAGEEDERLRKALVQLIGSKRQTLYAAMGKLEALSPLKVLTRGYAVAKDQTGRVLTDAETVDVGSAVSVTLQHGVLFCKVESRQAEGSQNFEVPGASKN